MKSENIDTNETDEDIMGPDATNPVFRVADKVRFKPTCSATETS